MISKEQKTNLAKLLATENITVEHKKVETAYFIPKTRILCLPLWEDMSNDLYDLLVGHEVGHAFGIGHAEIIGHIMNSDYGLIGTKFWIP